MTVTKPHPTLFHRVFRAVWYVFVVVLVLVAVALSLVRVFFPELGTFREDVERLASEALGHPVRITEFDARLVGITPTFIFRDIRLVDDDGRDIVHFDEARIGLAVISSLLEMKAVPDEVSVSGLDLSVIRHHDGTLSLEGVDLGQLQAQAPAPAGTEAAGDVTEWLFSRTHLELRDSTILWRDDLRHRRALKFSRVRVVLRSSGERHLLDGSFQPPPGYGERVSFAVDLNGDIQNPQSWQGQFWTDCNDLSLDKLEDYIQTAVALPSAGKTGFELWGTFADGHMKNVEGRLQVDELAFRPKGGKAVHLPDVKTLFALRRQGDGWRVDLADMQIRRGVDVWPAMKFTLIFNPQAARETDQIRLWAEVLPLAQVADVVARSSLLSAEQGKALEALAPAGRLESVYLCLPAKREVTHGFEFSARLRDVDVQAWGKFPGVRRLSAQVWSSGERGWLRIDPQATELRFATLFREPLPLTELDARVHWFRYADEWHVVSDQLKAHNDDFRASAALRLVIPERKRATYMDLQVRFGDADIAAAPRYLPVGIMKPKLIKWLDTALAAGTVKQGTVIYNGRLADFPFRRGEGRFRVEHDVEGLELRYQADWPAVRKAHGTAWFSGSGFGIAIDEGELQGNAIERTIAGVEDYRRPLLNVEARVAGSTGGLLAFLSHSPIANKAHDFVDGIETAGTVKTEFHMRLPLKAALRKTHPLNYQGRVALNKAAFHLFDGRVNATDLHGAILFSDQGQSSEGLEGLVFGHPAQFTVYSTHVAGLRRDHIAVNASGELKLLWQRLDLPAFRAREQQIPLQALYTFGTYGKEIYAPPQLVVTTELEAGSVDLPPPLDKLQEPLPLVFEMLLGSRTRPVGEDRQLGFGLYLGQQVSMWMEAQRVKERLRPLRAALHFGSGAPRPPEEDILRITGNVARLDLRGWLALSQRERRDAGPPPVLPIQVDMGSVELLTTPADAAPDGREAAAGEGLAGVERAWTPTDFPPVDARIRQLRLDGKDVGAARMRLVHSASGIRLDEFRLASDVMTISGHGEWRTRFNRQDTTLFITANSSNVGDMFRRLGYTAIIEQGKGQVDLTLYWEDALPRFDWAKASGTLSVDLADGNIVEVDPGAGRLLGLLSLSALPRRLFLDFRDFSKGFRFDSIKGRFTIREGNAYTEGDLVVKGTVGKVLLRGRTGLAAKDFDSTLTVIPGAADVAAGGLFVFSEPSSAVALWILNKLTGSSFDRGLASEYRITGSWEEPLIERISGEPEAAPAEPAPATAEPADDADDET